MEGVYHDEVEIEDFDYDEDTDTYYYPCPCGDKFEITKVILLIITQQRERWTSHTIH